MKTKKLTKHPGIPMMDFHVRNVSLIASGIEAAVDSTMINWQVGDTALRAWQVYDLILAEAERRVRKTL